MAENYWEIIIFGRANVNLFKAFGGLLAQSSSGSIILAIISRGVILRYRIFRKCHWQKLDLDESRVSKFYGAKSWKIKNVM